MTLRLKLAAAAASLVMSAGMAVANTVAIVGGVTNVEVTAPLGALGLTGSTFGTATVDGSGANPVFSFGITGGEAGGPTLIEHDGSGVTLTAAADPTIRATVADFLIDVDNAQVLGNVEGGPQGVQLFTFGGTNSVGAVELLISGTLAGALTSVFGASDLTGAQFGFATPLPEVAPVPLPAGVLLLGAGIGGLALVRRREQKKAIAA